MELEELIKKYWFFLLILFLVVFYVGSKNYEFKQSLYQQYEDCDPPSCPSGYTDEGVTCSGDTCVRDCTKTETVYDNQYCTASCDACVMSAVCDPGPFVGACPDSNCPYDTDTCDPDSCPSGYTDEGVEVDDCSTCEDYDGNCYQYRYSWKRTCSKEETTHYETSCEREVITTTTVPPTTTTVPKECETDQDCIDDYKICDMKCQDGECVNAYTHHPPKTCPDGTIIEWEGYPDCEYPDCPEVTTTTTTLPPTTTTAPTTTAPTTTTTIPLTCEEKGMECVPEDEDCGLGSTEYPELTCPAGEKCCGPNVALYFGIVVAIVVLIAIAYFVTRRGRGMF